MKKFLLVAFTFIYALVACAQEVMEETSETGTWSTETKQYALGAFVAFILILVFRAFRNKPTA